MAIVHEIPELDRTGLRQFGLMTGGIIAVLFGLFFPWLFDATWPLWPWIVFAVLGIWALIAPQSLNPVYKVWMRFGLLLSKITTPIIMGVVFYLLVMPFGVVMRLFGKDPMRRGYDDNAESYRINSSEVQKGNLENPF